MDWLEDFDAGLLNDEALRFLVAYHLDGAAKGITSRVITHGLHGLSPKQLRVFKAEVVDEWLFRTCKCCQTSIEGNELICAWENDGYCGSCANMICKDEMRHGIENPF